MTTAALQRPNQGDVALQGAAVRADRGIPTARGPVAEQADYGIIPESTT